jgi:hypothetical protein
MDTEPLIAQLPTTSKPAVDVALSQFHPTPNPTAISLFPLNFFIVIQVDVCHKASQQNSVRISYLEATYPYSRTILAPYMAFPI